MMNSRKMMLALFFLFAQNVLAVEEICSICHVNSPLDSTSGVAVTHCPGRHEFCADCLQGWIRTKEQDQRDLGYYDDYEIVVRCPLCNYELPDARHHPIIPATCQIAFTKFWRQPSKKTFKKWMEWQLKYLASLPAVQRLTQVYSIEFWRNIDYLTLFRRFFPIIIPMILYCIYLLFTIQSLGDLLLVSSITLKWPTYFPLAGLGFIIGLYLRYYIGTGRSFRSLIKDNFSLARNNVTNFVQTNRTHIFVVIFLWLVWAYHSFVYMGLFHQTTVSMLFQITFILAPMVINYFYTLFTSYHHHDMQSMMRNFPIFVAVLYGFNEVAFRLLAPIFSRVIIPGYNAYLHVGRGGMSMLSNLGANVWSFLISMGTPLMAFIMNYSIYVIGGLFAIFLLKFFFNRRKNN